jgi:hypothetical protein
VYRNKREPVILYRRKARSDVERWKPDIKAVRATIKYAIAAGRLNTEQEQEPDQSQ